MANDFIGLKCDSSLAGCADFAGLIGQDNKTRSPPVTSTIWYLLITHCLHQPLDHFCSMVDATVRWHAASLASTWLAAGRYLGHPPHRFFTPKESLHV